MSYSNNIHEIPQLPINFVNNHWLHCKQNQCINASLATHWSWYIVQRIQNVQFIHHDFHLVEYFIIVCWYFDNASMNCIRSNLMWNQCNWKIVIHHKRTIITCRHWWYRKYAQKHYVWHSCERIDCIDDLPHMHLFLC